MSCSVDAEIERESVKEESGLLFIKMRHIDTQKKSSSETGIPRIPYGIVWLYNLIWFWYYKF